MAEVDGPWAISGRAFFFAYLLPLFDEMKSRLVLKVAYSQNIFHLGSNLPKKVPNHYSEHHILSG